MDLLNHLTTFAVDGATVASSLFEGGRLAYPGRKAIEHELGYVEPYTLEMEARVILGFSVGMRVAVRFLASMATEFYRGKDDTLDLLWNSHNEFSYRDIGESGPSPDRLMTALVAIEGLSSGEIEQDEMRFGGLAAEQLVRALHKEGFPPNEASLEELFDGAWPACIGLNLVSI